MRCRGWQARRAPLLRYEADEHVRDAGAELRLVEDRQGHDNRIGVGGLDAIALLPEDFCQGDAVDSGARQPQGQLERVARLAEFALIDDDEAGDAPKALAHALDGVNDPSELELAMLVHDRARGIDRGHQGARGRRGRGEIDRSVEPARIDPRPANGHDCGLGVAQERLVHARGDNVGALLKGAAPGHEEQVRTPRLVHDERAAGTVAALGQARGIGQGADVGRRGDEHRNGR
ncbi:unannotated protein [freshwater metagenome]|uniref:Unannotated protein n=1 Tax=freshwater metagenome TaxID=449393 RepID=A0A6J7DN11_9ZZZZ